MSSLGHPGVFRAGRAGGQRWRQWLAALDLYEEWPRMVSHPGRRGKKLAKKALVGDHAQTLPFLFFLWVRGFLWVLAYTNYFAGSDFWSVFSAPKS